MAYTGGLELSPLALVDELDELDRQLEMALGKVRARKVLGRHRIMNEHRISESSVAPISTRKVKGEGNLTDTEL
jgi:hypothetical protein